VLGLKPLDGMRLAGQQKLPAVFETLQQQPTISTSFQGLQFNQQ
jgi:hypothetical protein